MPLTGDNGKTWGNRGMSLTLRSMTRLAKKAHYHRDEHGEVSHPPGLRTRGAALGRQRWV